MTSVVVRSSANNSAGAKSKMSAIIHGVLLLIGVAVPVILNKIPVTLATIIILVGYKLAKPATLFTFGKRKISIYSFIATW
jgi:MFS superfamily sulfate permease-like transporter